MWLDNIIELDFLMAENRVSQATFVRNMRMICSQLYLGVVVVFIREG